MILDLLSENISLSPKAISEKGSEKINVSSRTVETDLARLKFQGLIARVSGRKDGHWVILEKES